MISRALLDAWRNLLDLSKLRPTETVAILVGEITDPAHLQAARAVLAEKAQTYYVMEFGESAGGKVGGDSTAAYVPTALAANQIAIDALKKTPFIIDLMGMYRGGEQKEILNAGARIILVKEKPETFIRLAPCPDDRQRVLRALRLIQNSPEMHVVSKGGTDMTARFGDLEYLCQYGYADERGRWDHCPSAFVGAWPNEGSANGTVVLNEGDVILPFKYYLRTPIHLEIEDGFIRNIAGGFDARYLRDYMASFNEPESYAVSHLGWGLHSRAHWTGLGMYDKRQMNGQESRSFPGCFMFSTGPNVEAGGGREVACHLDIPMLDCTVSIGDTTVVEDGALTA